MIMFTEVKKEDVFKAPYKKLKGELESFISMGVECVRVTFDRYGYKNVKTAQNTLAVAAKRYALPIRVSQRNGKLYLLRTDM